MNRQVNIYDESLILEGAARVAAGAVPHRDFYANYGPAQFYILGSLFKTMGFSVLVERLWDTVTRAGIATCAFILVGAATSRWLGLAAAAVVVIWLSWVGNYGFPAFPSLLCALIALICLLPLLDGRRSTLWLFASGCALGMTVLFRYDVGFYATVSISLALIIFTLRNPEDGNRRTAGILRRLGACWLGVALLCVPVAIGYVLDGVLSDFKLDVIDFPAHFYRAMRGLPFPSPGDIARSPMDAGVYLPPLIWLGTAAIGLVGARSGRRIFGNDKRSWIVFILVMMSALFYLKGLVRVSVLHMTISIIPALLVVAILPLRAAMPRMAIGMTAVLGTAGCLLTLVLVAPVAGTARQNLGWVLHGDVETATGPDNAALGSCRPAMELTRLACFETDDNRALAVAYIADHSKPGDTIFDGLPHYDRIFINDMLIYFLTGRQPATKWYHFDPGLQTSRPIQSQMINDLEREKPVFVISDAEFSGIHEPNASSRSSGVTLLDDFINAHYATAQRFGAITVLHSKGD